MLRIPAACNAAISSAAATSFRSLPASSRSRCEGVASRPRSVTRRAGISDTIPEMSLEDPDLAALKAELRNRAADIAEREAGLRKREKELERWEARIERQRAALRRRASRLPRVRALLEQLESRAREAAARAKSEQPEVTPDPQQNGSGPAPAAEKPRRALSRRGRR